MYDFVTTIRRDPNKAAKWKLIERVMGPGNQDVLAMSVADMELPVLPDITEAIVKEATDCPMYGYTTATDSYYEAVIGWQEKRHNWLTKREWISLAPGVVSAMNIAVRAFTHPGDRVIIQPPVYHPFDAVVRANGCEVVTNPLIKNGDEYVMDYADLERKAADPRTKCLLLCSPHNPVGRVWKEEELAALGEICLKHNVIVISDEIHYDFVYGSNKHVVFANISKELEQNCLVLTAPSKTFNLAGLKTSNIFIPNPRLREQYEIAKQNSPVGGINMFGYAACEAAYRHGEKWLDELLVHLEDNRRFAETYIAENLPGFVTTPAEGTYFLWVDCSCLGMDGPAMEKFMQQKARLFLSEGYTFGEGGAGYERINLACTRSMLEDALDRIKAAVKQLNQL